MKELRDLKDLTKHDVNDREKSILVETSSLALTSWGVHCSEASNDSRSTPAGWSDEKSRSTRVRPGLCSYLAECIHQ